jgi:hypothetical protein
MASESATANVWPGASGSSGWRESVACSSRCSTHHDRVSSSSSGGIYSHSSSGSSFFSRRGDTKEDPAASRMTIPVLPRASCGYGAERSAKRPSDDELRDLVWVGTELKDHIEPHVWFW